MAKLFELQDLSNEASIRPSMSPREYNPAMTRRQPLNRVPIAVLAAAVFLAQGTPGAQNRSLAPYVPTPSDVVDRMLTLAKVSARDVVYDLGCGDGRIVIAAAQKFGARGVGVDIDANLINQAEASAKAAGVDPTLARATAPGGTRPSARTRATSKARRSRRDASR